MDMGLGKYNDELNFGQRWSKVYSWEVREAKKLPEKALAYAAAFNDEYAVVDALLERGYDIDASFALHSAALHGKTAMVRFLVRRGATKDLRNSEGKTAAEIARYVHNGQEIVDFLTGNLSPTERKWTDMSVQTLEQEGFEKSDLFQAIRFSTLEVVRHMVSTDPEGMLEQTVNWQSPYGLASDLERRELSELLDEDYWK